MSAPPSTTGNTGPPALQAPTGTPALQVPSGTPTLQTSGTPAQTQGGSSPTTGSSMSAKPFIPAKFDLPMLDNDSENYDTWYTALQLTLDNWGIWPIVTGTELRLDWTTDPTGHKEWGLKDHEARLMILLALRKVSQNCIFCGTSSKEYWDRIASRYSSTGGGNEHTVSLLQQFFMISFKDSEPMQPQIDWVVHAA